EGEIEGWILEGVPESEAPPSEGIGKAYRLEDGKGRYIEFVKSHVGTGNLKGLRVVVDCANGATYEVGPLILREMGAEVIPCGVSPNGLNINAACGALHPEVAQKLVRERQADVGVTFDGDG